MPGAAEAPPAAPPASQRARARRRTAVGLVLVLLLATFAAAPLTYPGFIETQSGLVPAYRAQDPLGSWVIPQEPVRGEGRLPYALVWPALRLTGSGTAAVRWGYALAFLFGAATCYAWTRRWLGVQGGVLAATVYTMLPWHVGAVYVRGAYAEAWLWGLAPAAFWAMDGLCRGRRPAAGAAWVVVMAACFWVQPGLAALLVTLAAAYAASLTPGRRWLAGTAAAALAVAVLALLAKWAPPQGAAPAEGLLEPFQLLSPDWTAAPAFQIGAAAFGLALLSTVLWLSRRRSPGAGAAARKPGCSPSLGRRLAFWAVALLVLLALALRPAGRLWHLTGLGRLVDQPWQILVLAGLPLAFLAGAAVRLDRRLGRLPAWAGLVALVVLASTPYLAPRFTQVEPGARPAAVFRAASAPGPQVMLVSAETTPSSAITSTLTITLTWQAVRPVPENYTVFVHLLAPEKVAQGDGLPCSGACLTPTWTPGALVVDRHQVLLPSGAPPGPYRLALGLYRGDTGERAAIAGRDDGTVFVDVRQ